MPIQSAPILPPDDTNPHSAEAIAQPPVAYPAQPSSNPIAHPDFPQLDTALPTQLEPITHPMPIPETNFGLVDSSSSFAFGLGHETTQAFGTEQAFSMEPMFGMEPAFGTGLFWNPWVEGVNDFGQFRVYTVLHIADIPSAQPQKTLMR
jgi:hypothetical protein